MLVKDVLQKCDKNMDVCIDMYNGAADYLVENFLIANDIKNVKSHDLLNSHINGIALVSPREVGTDKHSVLKVAQEIVVSSKVKSLNKFLAAGGTIECFGDLQVEFLDQNSDGQFEVHTEEK